MKSLENLMKFADMYPIPTAFKFGSRAREASELEDSEYISYSMKVSNERMVSNYTYSNDLGFIS